MNVASNAATGLAAALPSPCALAGCATLPDAPAKEHAAARDDAVAAGHRQRAAARRRARAARRRNAASPTSSLRTFADVTRDAKELPGLFRLWQKDDKVWIEIAPDQFDQHVLLLDQPRPGPGREPLPRGLDDEQPVAPVRRSCHRRVPQGRPQRAARRAQREVHRASRHAGGARRRGRVLRQPARHGAGRVAAASRAQVDPGRSERALLRRPARRGAAARAGVSPVVRVRLAQFVLPRSAQHGRTSLRSA